MGGAAYIGERDRCVPDVLLAQIFDKVLQEHRPISDLAVDGDLRAVAALEDDFFKRLRHLFRR